MFDRLRAFYRHAQERSLLLCPAQDSEPFNVLAQDSADDLLACPGESHALGLLMSHSRADRSPGVCLCSAQDTRGPFYVLAQDNMSLLDRLAQDKCRCGTKTQDQLLTSRCIIESWMKSRD